MKKKIIEKKIGTVMTYVTMKHIILLTRQNKQFYPLEWGKRGFISMARRGGEPWLPRHRLALSTTAVKGGAGKSEKKDCGVLCR